MERTQCSTDSDYDTDDLIEDARNFVITAKRYSCHKWFSKNFIVTVSFGAAHIYVIPDQLTLTSMQSRFFRSKLVDMSDWADIDKKRRTRRQKRTEKRRKGTGSRSKTSRYNRGGCKECKFMRSDFDCMPIQNLCTIYDVSICTMFVHNIKFEQECRLCSTPSMH